ncbi:MAG: hypothetical protein MJ090_00795 [Clostridia bacterium]|nr:hypothetical protein [Clostridia bacterium]
MTALVLKIILILLLGSVLVIMLKPNRPEIGILLSVGISTVAISFIIKSFYNPIKSLLDIYNKTTANGFNISVVIKAVIISYLTQFCADTCRDFGLSAIAEKAELTGKCAILVLSVPLINSVLKTALELTKL